MVEATEAKSCKKESDEAVLGLVRVKEKAGGIKQNGDEGTYMYLPARAQAGVSMLFDAELGSAF